MSERLFDAIESHDLNKLRQLLASGADPSVEQNEWPKFTPLHAAIEELESGGSIETIRELIGFGADVNKWDGLRDAPPLLMAVFRNRVDVVAALLAEGANPNVRGSEGDSPLRWAVSVNDERMARLLIEHGADETIDEIGSPGGFTALGIAVRDLDENLVRMLLDYGASPDHADENLWPAYKLLPEPTDANTESRRAIMELLFQAHTRTSGPLDK